MDKNILVIGSGIAGMSAAITAAEAGARVTVLEKMDITGGSSIRSGGNVYVALNAADAEVMKDYLLSRAEGLADENMVSYMAKDSLTTLGWLAEMGVEWISAHAGGTAPELRAHHTHGGKGLMTPMYDRAAALGIQILTSTRVLTLLTDAAGTVCGVRASCAEGEKDFPADAVILCTGGFDVSEDMKKLYAPIAVGDRSSSGAGNTGDALLMAKTVNADTVFHNGVIGSQGTALSLGYGVPLYVTETGAFASFPEDYPITYANLKASGGKAYYGIYDGKAKPPSTSAETPYFFSGATVNALAESCGMDAAELSAAVARCDTLVEGPYYAVKVSTQCLGSFGGLKVDLQAHVLSGGVPVSGLFAAGEVANGDFFGRQYPGSGISLSMCITFGRLAGASAANVFSPLHSKPKKD